MDSNGAQVIEVAGTGGLIVLFITNFFGFFTTVISLAEMASIAPTAGGQYQLSVLCERLMTTVKF